MRLPRRVIGLIIILAVLLTTFKLYSNQTPNESRLDAYRRHKEEAAEELKLKKPKKPTTPDDGDEPKKPEPLRKFSQKVASVTDTPFEYQKVLKVMHKALQDMVEVSAEAETLSTYDLQIIMDNAKIVHGDLPPTSGILSRYLQVSESESSKLKKIHSNVVSLIPKVAIDEAFSRRGLVMAAWGASFPMALASLKWLRDTNEELPVEILIPFKSDWETKLCEEALPTMNAKCVVMEDFISHDIVSRLMPSSEENEGALRHLALLASSFQEIVYVRPSTVFIEDPESLFYTEPYKETGLLLNRDNYENVISPHFYDIANITLGDRARGRGISPVDIIRQSDREGAVPGFGTDSSQVVVDKQRHIQSILLSIYYNIRKDVFYPLFVQGLTNTGFKESLAAAATALKEPYYKSELQPKRLGFRRDSDQLEFGVSRSDPDSDFRRSVKFSVDYPNRQFFIDPTGLRANPRYMILDRMTEMPNIPALQQCRYFGDAESQKKQAGSVFDVEDRYFQTMTELVCDWANGRDWVPDNWKNLNLETMCKVLHGHIIWLRENPNAQGPEDPEGLEYDPSSEQTNDDPSSQ